MPEKAPPKRFRWLRRIVLAAGVVIGGVALLVWWDFRRDRVAWNEACAEADHDDPGWRAVDFFGPENYTPPGPTLTGRVKAIHDKLPRRWPDWPQIVRDEDVEALSFLNPLYMPDPDEEPAQPPESAEERKHRAISALEMPRQRWPNRLRHEIERKYWREAISDNLVAEARALIGVAPAAKLGQWKRPLLNQIDVNSESRKVVQVLKEHLVFVAEDRQIDEALLDVRAMLAIARALEERPMLISSLFQSALHSIAAQATMNALALGEASPIVLASLQADLQSVAQSHTFLKHLRGEQAVFEDYMRSYLERLVTPEQLREFAELDVPKVTGWERADQWIHRLRGGEWRMRHSAEMLRYYQALIHAMQNSPDGLTIQSNRPADIRAAMSPIVAKATTVDVLTFQADPRRRAQLNCAIAAVAAERFRLDSGRWPATLGVLVPKYLTTVPSDPFDSKPLRFRQVADGLVIYSISTDLADDDGDVEYWRPGTLNTKDVGLRLFDVARRRLPAETP